MTELEALKRKYTDVYYEDGCLRLPNQQHDFLGEQDTKALIDEYYEDSELIIAHPSGNPELEYPITVEGYVYVIEKFGGDYKKAFDAV